MVNEHFTLLSPRDIGRSTGMMGTVMEVEEIGTEKREENTFTIKSESFAL